MNAPSHMRAESTSSLSRSALADREVSLAGSLVRYGVSTGLSFFINIGLTVLLHELLGAPEEIAYAIGLACAFLANFFMLRHYIYGSATGSAQKQFLFFFASSLSFRGAEYALFLLFHSVAGFQYILVIFGVQSISALTKFFFYRHLFAKR